MVIIRPDGIDENFNYQLFKYLKTYFYKLHFWKCTASTTNKRFKNNFNTVPTTPRTKSHSRSAVQPRRQNRPTPKTKPNPRKFAQTLFRKYFIQDKKKDWEKKPLSYFGNIICGKTPSKKITEYFGGKIPFIKIPDMQTMYLFLRQKIALLKKAIFHKTIKLSHQNLFASVVLQSRLLFCRLGWTALRLWLFVKQLKN